MDTKIDRKLDGMNVMSATGSDARVAAFALFHSVDD